MFGITKDVMIAGAAHMAERVSKALEAVGRDVRDFSPSYVGEFLRMAPANDHWWARDDFVRQAIVREIQLTLSGCEALGNGAFSAVFALPAEFDGRKWCLKLGVKPREDWTARAFAVYCKEYHAALPGLPEILDTGTTQNDLVWWAIMPMYSKMGEYQARDLRYVFDTLGNKNYPPTNSDISYAERIVRDLGCEDHIITLQLVADFMHLIGAHSDLHSDNVMADERGRPVYTDPIHGGDGAQQFSAQRKIVAAGTVRAAYL